MSRRQLIAIRLSETGLAALDDLAAKEQVNRSEMVRRLLSEAITARQRRGSPPKTR